MNPPVIEYNVDLIHLSKASNGVLNIELQAVPGTSARRVNCTLYCLAAYVEKALERLGGTCYVFVDTNADAIRISPLNPGDDAICEQLVPLIGGLTTKPRTRGAGM